MTINCTVILKLVKINWIMLQNHFVEVHVKNTAKNSIWPSFEISWTMNITNYDTCNIFYISRLKESLGLHRQLKWYPTFVYSLKEKIWFIQVCTVCEYAYSQLLFAYSAAIVYITQIMIHKLSALSNFNTWNITQTLGNGESKTKTITYATYMHIQVNHTQKWS